MVTCSQAASTTWEVIAHRRILLPPDCPEIQHGQTVYVQQLRSLPVRNGIERKA
jgi:hypothetical protein